MSLEPRLVWLRDKICRSLGVDEELFLELLNDDGQRSLIASFLDGGTALDNYTNELRVTLWNILCKMCMMNLYVRSHAPYLASWVVRNKVDRVACADTIVIIYL